jgi:predicted secreted protein
MTPSKTLLLASLALSGCQASSSPAAGGAGAAAPGPAASSGPAVYDQTTTAISAKVGDHFTVALPGNVSTGYVWRLEPKPDGSIVVAADATYATDPHVGSPVCAGCPGTFSFALTANAAGSATLHFVDIPPGGPRPGAPSKEISIALTVHALTVHALTVQ